MVKPAAEKRQTQGLALYESGPLGFTGTDDVYDRHLVFDHAVSLAKASDRERFEAVARTLRDLLTQRWLLTDQTYEQANSKRVSYLSMEFLIGGRSFITSSTSPSRSSSAIAFARIPARIGLKSSRQSQMPA